MKKYILNNFTKVEDDTMSTSFFNSITSDGSLAIANCVSYLTKGEHLHHQIKFKNLNRNLNKNLNLENLNRKFANFSQILNGNLKKIKIAHHIFILNLIEIFAKLNDLIFGCGSSTPKTKIEFLIESIL